MSDTDTVYPAGTRAGFLIEAPNVVLDLSLLTLGLLGIVNINGRHMVSFAATVPFDLALVRVWAGA